MSTYKSAFTGSQIDQAVSQVLSESNQGNAKGLYRHNIWIQTSNYPICRVAFSVITEDSAKYTTLAEVLSALANSTLYSENYTKTWVPASGGVKVEESSNNIAPVWSINLSQTAQATIKYIGTSNPSGSMTVAPTTTLGHDAVLAL